MNENSSENNNFNTTMQNQQDNYCDSVNSNVFDRTESDKNETVITASTSVTSGVNSGNQDGGLDNNEDFIHESTPLCVDEQKLKISTPNNNGSMISAWGKFKLLLWKNWLMQWRHPIRLAVEIIAPILYSLLLVVIRHLVDPIPHNEPTIYEPFETVPTEFIPKVTNSILFGSASDAVNISFPYRQFAWSPNNALLANVMASVSQKTIILRDQPFENSSTLWKNLTTLDKMNETLAGIIFPDEYANLNDKLPQNINFSLVFPGESRFGPLPETMSEMYFSNWRTNLLYPAYTIPGPRSPSYNDGGYPPGYHAEGFLLFQQIITQTLMEFVMKEVKNTNVHIPKIELQRYPYPEYIEDPILPALAGFISLIFMLSFVYTCKSTVQLITIEKEKQLKEVMKIMGLPSWLHWTAWFINSSMFAIIQAGLCTLLLTIHWYSNSKVSVFTNSNPAIIFLVLLMYLFCTILFSFMISVFFSKANTAAGLAGLIWFFSYSPYIFLQQRYDQLSFVTKIFSCLGHNTAMSWAFLLIIRFEGTGAGVQWDNLFKPVNFGDSLVLGDILGMFILDGLIYLLITLYVEKIFPGDYGIPLPWYFPFTKSYWCGEKVYYSDNTASNESKSDIYETEPTHLKPGVQIKNLRKIYNQRSSNNKVAVDNLNLNLYEGQITCLLGHNGAGKTTTMNILTGMLPPSSGTAVVNGYDINKNLNLVRSSLGLCPQHNVLFDELTVREHLYFYSRLKGVPVSKIQDEIVKYIELLELVPKTNVQSSKLSGGMQRKLCTGIALCGGSKVVMFDEPTSGMDPAARRALWDLLQKEKHGRTIVLSTHFMDEADILGDRIAIMAGGKLQCCGSSFFLKKRYGAGYHLIMEKSPSCNVNDVTNLLKEYIPDLGANTNIGSELTYILPESQVAKFESMLKKLESNGPELGINNFGISLTTLEEVFMKVGEEYQQDSKLSNDNHNLNNKFMTENDFKLMLEDPERKSGFSLILVQFHAMIMKRMISLYRNWILILIQIIIPTIMLIIAIWAIRKSTYAPELPPLALDIQKYPDTVTVLNPMGTDTKANKTIENFKAVLKSHTSLENTNQDFSDYILQKSRDALNVVRTRYIAGFSVFNKGKIRCWFNNEAYHSAPIALNLAFNAILKEIDPNRTISVTNKPLPFTLSTKMMQLTQGNSLGFQLGFNIGFSMALISAFYILFYVKERISKSKHLQFVSGVNVITFWCSAFICDLMTFCLTVICLLITLVCFQEDGYKTASDIGRLFVVLLVFGIAMLPLTFLASFFFDIPSIGFVRMVLFSLVTGVAAYITVQILSLPDLELQHVSKILEWCFLILPHYSLSSSISSEYLTYAIVANCKLACSNSIKPMDQCLEELCNKTICCDLEERYYKWKAPGVGRQITFSFLAFLLFTTILLLKEYRIFKRLGYVTKMYLRRKPKIETDTQLNDDVLYENAKVKNLTPTEIKDYSVVLKNVSKYYKNFLAVNQLSIAVRNFECFGLLGVNGAGKTTTFKMLTGDIDITYGDIWVQGISVKKDMKEVYKIIGYCPQFDALLEELTGRETMKMFCYLRGITGYTVDEISNTLATELDFLPHIDKEVKQYSGGNKRKLSTAIALISNPAVIYLDEPTTGMDPATKRHLWNVICKVRNSGRCVILTSHSMEECEALCTKIAIMVNGEFQCLGSVQHLKNKFSSGFILKIKLRPIDDQDTLTREINTIVSYIENKFVKVKLQEKHRDLLTFHITNTTLKWSSMFGIMEQAKQTLNFEDYSISQSSLEQVFLSFTKKQREE